MVVYCCVKGCSRNARCDQEHSFFRIPKDHQLREKWLEFAGLTKAGINLFICMDHFEEKYIRKRHPRPLLRKNSIPTIRSAGKIIKAKNDVSNRNKSPVRDEDMAIDENTEKENQPKIPKIDAFSGSCMDTTHELLQGTSAFSPPRHGQERIPLPNACTNNITVNITPKTLRINTQRRTISNLRSKIYRLKHQDNPICRKQKLSQQKIESLLEESAPFLSKEAKILFAAQLRLASLKKRGERYASHVKDIALSIYYHSPKAYRYLKKNLNLPSERTLRSYQSQFPIYPGLNQSVLQSLNLKFKDAPVQDRLVSLVIDEISLQPEVHYDPKSDKFIGYADNGVVRQPNIAKSAAVIMLTWINRKAKQVIGFTFLGSNNNSDNMHELILESIDKVMEQGLIVKSVIFDQGPRNQGFLSKVGVTTKKPYFYKNGEKIYVIYDAPHLLKSLRNNLLTKTLRYKGGTVNWCEIGEVFKLSSTNPLNLIPKISKKHFKMNKFSKMRVSLAAQIFSESMYTAHLVYKTMFPEKFDDNSTTSQFLIDIDKLFDCLNSSLLRKTVPHKLNYAISSESEHVNFLKSMLAVFKEARFVGPQPPCMKGFQLTINAVLHLFDDLVINYNIKHLPTRRLNQDPLENLFATIRQQHGCSMYPSPMQFQAGVRHILITHLTKISNLSNCEADGDVICAKLSAIANVNPENSTDQLTISPSELFIFEKSLDSNPESEIQEFTEANAIYYISGYLCKKFLSHHDFVECSQLLINDNDDHYAEHKLFVITKNYADTHGLLHAKENVFKTILEWERLFQKVIRSIIHSSNICRVLQTIIQESCSTVNLCSTDNNNAFLKLFLRIRCYWEARFIRREISESKTRNEPTNSNDKMKKFTGKQL